MRRSGRRLRIAGSFLVLSGLLTGNAFADAVQAGVTIPAGQPVPVMTENGKGYTPGSYDGEIDASTFDIETFGLGTLKGQNLCLQNVVVPGGATYLATVHMSINNGEAASGLPATGVFSGFGAVLTTAGAVCAGLPASSATPNPISAPLPFTIR